MHQVFSLALATLLALIVSVGAAEAAGSASRTDILLLMPDQMRGDCLSILEHPVVRTR
ncbi:MAG: hypothetical protein WCK77_00070 [Verrucomicrobiota bacterium]